MSYIHIIISIFLIGIAGCDSSDTKSTKPFLLTKNSSKSIKKIDSNPSSAIQDKIALTNAYNRHKEKLASIAADKEKSIKQIELEQNRIENITKEKIAKSEHKSKVAIEHERAQKELILVKERAKLSQQYLIAGMILIISILLILFLMHRRNQLLKLKLQEEELRHKEQMQIGQQHHERINKTLEILANESTDKSLKQELIKLLKDQGVKQTKLLK